MNLPNKLNKKVVIASTIKDVENHLENFFKVILNITKIYQKYFIILVESDSKDNTYVKSKNYLNKLHGKLFKVNTSKYSHRTERLSLCRNKYLDFIKKNKILKKYDHLIAMDSDSINNLINSKKIIKAISDAPRDWAGIFPSQIISYYDLWTLRIPKVFSYDCYQKLIQISKKIGPKKAYDKIIFKNFFLVNKIKKRYIEVDSAWGGMGIYRISKILHSKYDSKKGRFCEHVYFNKKIISKNSKLYIDKNMKNSLGLNEHFLKGFVYKNSNYFSKKLIEKSKKVF